MLQQWNVEGSIIIVKLQSQRSQTSGKAFSCRLVVPHLSDHSSQPIDISTYIMSIGGKWHEGVYMVLLNRIRRTLGLNFCSAERYMKAKKTLVSRVLVLFCYPKALRIVSMVGAGLLLSR